MRFIVKTCLCFNYQTPGNFLNCWQHLLPGEVVGDNGKTTSDKGDKLQVLRNQRPLNPTYTPHSPRPPEIYTQFIVH